MLDTTHKRQAQGRTLRSRPEVRAAEAFTGRLMVNVPGTVAGGVLDLNRERRVEGPKAAAARGRKGGRRRTLSDEDLAMARGLLQDPSIPGGPGRQAPRREPGQDPRVRSKGEAAKPGRGPRGGPGRPPLRRRSLAGRWLPHVPSARLGR